MNIPTHNLRIRRGGYVTLMMVISVSLVALALLAAVYKATLQARDVQKIVQVRVDVAQRENAILRSILALAPNKAIGAMQENSGSNPKLTACTWNTLFTQALAMANASDADGSENTASGLGGTGVRMGNAANFTTATDVFKAASGTGLVYAGVNARPSTSYPYFLSASSAIALADASYPIVTHDKTYGSIQTDGAQLSVTAYPRFNRISYPNIRFGYGTPGGTFVAKRNWWAFSIRYPSGVVGVPALRKQYVLSLYEVPSQVALSSSTFMGLGRHSDNSNWSGIQINGSVFGQRVLTEAALGNSVNRISGREGVDFSATATVGGTAVGNNFDSDVNNANSVQAVEAASSAGTYFPVSVASGAGRVAFIPLNRGNDFYRFIGTGVQPDTNTLSTTTWNDYSIGARQCAIKIRVTQAAAADNQTPTAIEVTYKTAGGTASVTLNRSNGTWPTTDMLVPFQTESTETGRNCLTVYVSRLAAWLAARGASGVTVNHSIAINPDPTGTNIRTLSFPSNSLDMAVVLRGGSNLTAFTNGFALVTNMRLFFADDLNTTSMAVPGGSGLTGTYFPPMAIFAPEKRWGTGTTARSIEFTGQIGSLDSGTGTMARPLDLRSGSGVGADPLATSVNATLNEITSPAQLPPVNFLNWMLTIEEVDTATGGVAGS